MPRDLTDKVMLITGASSGIGAATAVACAKAGMHITLAARREEKLRAVAEQVEALGRRAEVVLCDVALDDDVEQLFTRSWQAHGRLDAMFANAGYGLCASVLDMTDAQHRAIFETNYFGTMRCLKHGAANVRRTRGGLKHLLVCSSAASEIGLPMYGAYAATKAAQDSIAGAMRAEVAPEGMTVTSVHPGGTETEFFDVAFKMGGERNGPPRSNTPKAFVQTPAKVAKAVVRALRRPRPEVWPMFGARFGLALTTAFPGLAAWVMRRHAKKIVPVVAGSDEAQNNTKEPPA